jgi:hypothetical protein
VRSLYCTIIVLFAILTTGCFGKRDESPSNDESGVEEQTSDSKVVDGSAGSNGGVGGDGYTCGNNKIEPPEVCDGTDLGGVTCGSLTNNRWTGTLKCTADCRKYDETRCYEGYPVDTQIVDSGVIIRDTVRDTGIIDVDEAGTDQNRTLVTGGCALSTFSSCQSEGDCIVSGCVCYNRYLGPISTECYCTAPSSLSCGCVNGTCGWWQ